MKGYKKLIRWVFLHKEINSFLPRYISIFFKKCYGFLPSYLFLYLIVLFWGNTWEEPVMHHHLKKICHVFLGASTSLVIVSCIIAGFFLWLQRLSSCRDAFLYHPTPSYCNNNSYGLFEEVSLQLDIFHILVMVSCFSFYVC